MPIPTARDPMENAGMRLPKFRLRTLMVVVAIVAVILVPIAACLGWLHEKNAWISINGFTFHF